MNQEKNTAVVTVLGRDRVGIIADVSRLLADYGINIKDISQTILDDIFTMVMMVDLKDVVIEESDVNSVKSSVCRSPSSTQVFSMPCIQSDCLRGLYD